MTRETRKAVVIGASGGIGSAIAESLVALDFDVASLSRRAGDFDLADEGSIARAAERVGGEVDILIVATGVLEAGGLRPEKAFHEIAADPLRELFLVNAIGPALVYKHFAPRLRKQGRSVTAFLSARLGSIGDNRLGGWMGYRASKAALNQFVRCAAIEGARNNSQAIVLCLHPGTIETAMTKRLANGKFTASAKECARQLVDIVLAADASENGAFLDYRRRQIPW
jgi:NAD(P)-dependent dehydrogenase (short-subunit alcohol dehydrogenase family)